MEPTAAVTTLETALRQLMSREYEREYGTEWLGTVATAMQVEKWTGRSETERAKRSGVAVVAPTGLAYAEFYELLNIAEAHWEPLAAALGKKAPAMALLWRFEKLRDSVAHSRPLVPFEAELMSGIAGEIRNKVTMHMSSKDPAGDTYPRIESAQDSFGRTIEIWPTVDEIAGSVAADAPTPVVYPGDEVIFTCVATDPEGRDLRWWIRTDSPELGEVLAPAGGPTQVVWVVRDEDVRESLGVNIYMQTIGTKYHRVGTYDHRTYFMFTVRPRP